MTVRRELLTLVSRTLPAVAAAYLRGLNQHRAYQAARPTPQHPTRGDGHSADLNIELAGPALRNHARWLDENHDLSVGVLDTLVNRIVGAGILPEPMVRTRGGELHEGINTAIRALRDEWAMRPEMTQSDALAECQRIECRTWLRDGEHFIQHLEATPRYPYPSAVPYAYEMLEPDFVPYDLIDESRNIVHGIERDAFRIPRVYHFLRQHPGALRGRFTTIRDTIPVSAARVTHRRFTRRMHQARGVSLFHAVLRRLQYIDSWEETEMIAAKVAAALTVVMTKSPDTALTAAEKERIGQRQGLKMQPGMILTDVLPGEEPKVVSSDRPNPNLGDHRFDMLRAVSAGTGAGASTIGRRYEGNYSAQRQELVEGDVGYARLHGAFVASGEIQKWARLLDLAVLSKALILDGDVDLATLHHADYPRPPLPWIQPLQEANADVALIEAEIESLEAVQRRRGLDPRRVAAEIAARPKTAARPGAAEPEPELDEELEDDTLSDEENAA